MSIDWQWWYVHGFFFVSGACLAILIVTTVRVWKAHRAAMKSLDIYNQALQAATEALKANPERWLDYHKALDDHRRLH